MCLILGRSVDRKAQGRREMREMRDHGQSTGYLGRCWEVADGQIRHFKEALDKALRGEGKANPAICREKIDQWLEYRYSHGPDDEARL
jgi:hypothetical protein